jgi:hypothetical protein
LDTFTLQRIRKFVLDFRVRSGQLPTLSDIEKAGFPKTAVELAKKKKLIEELYVTLTNGSIVKGFKAKTE